jgi:hypothetical protein
MRVILIITTVKEYSILKYEQKKVIFENKKFSKIQVREKIPIII